jgi:hypothetical protein
MATLVAGLFTDEIGINILSFLDHKTEIEYKIKLVCDKLNLAEKNDDCDMVDELVYKLECLYEYLNDPTVWVTGDMVDDANDCYYDSDYSDYS